MCRVRGVRGVLWEVVRREGGRGQDRAAEDDQREARQEPEPEERARGDGGPGEGEDVPDEELGERPLTDGSLCAAPPPPPFELFGSGASEHLSTVDYFWVLVFDVGALHCWER